MATHRPLQKAKTSFSAHLLAPYRRVTSSGQLIPEIDGLRFIAIFSVYVYHVAGDILRHSSPEQKATFGGHWLFSVTQILNVGVPVFFVISGFILGVPFAKAHLHGAQRMPLKKYFLRRITRLEPPYILSLLLFLALKIAGGRGTSAELFPHLLASAFYLHNLVYGAPSVINFVAWSLEIEIQFYLLAPFLALVFAVSLPGLRLSLLVLAVLLATGMSFMFSGALALSLLGYAQYFLAGFVLVDLYLASHLQRRRSWYWDVAAIASWFLLLQLLMNYGRTAAWSGPWLILLMFVGAFRGNLVNYFVTNAWIATIGGMCYSLYLLHNYIVAGVGPITERLFAGYSFPARLLIQLILMTPFVLGVSALYFRWLERPCMRPDWPQRLKAAFDRRREGGTLELSLSSESSSDD